MARLGAPGLRRPERRRDGVLSHQTPGGRETASRRSSPGLHEVGGVAAVVVGAAGVTEQVAGLGQRSQPGAGAEAGQGAAAEQVAGRGVGGGRRRPQLHLRQEVELTADGHVLQMVLRLQLVQTARLHCQGDTLARLCPQTGHMNVTQDADRSHLSAQTQTGRK